MFTSQKERQQLARDQREQEREMTRQEKRALRDLRYCAERSTLSAVEWRDFLRLHELHGKEGIRELFEFLIPYWNQCQLRNGGDQCPSELLPVGLKLSAENTRTTPTTRKSPGAPRKPRTDAGRPRATYKQRKRANTKAAPVIKD
jgi:hypothetical protein